MMINKEKLLAGIKRPGVQITECELAKYMATSGALVSVSVSRARTEVPLTERAYGVDLDLFNEEGKAFYGAQVKQGRLQFLPRQDVKELDTLDKAARRAVEVRALTKNRSPLFVPLAVYEELEADFSEIRTKYFQKRDEILAKWDLLVAVFEDGVRKMLEGVRMDNEFRDKLVAGFVQALPSKDAYAASFDMKLRAELIPTTPGKLEGLNSSVQAIVKDTWKDDVVSTAIASIETQVGDGWSRLMKAIRQYDKNGTIKTTTINGLTKFATDLNWKNVFNNVLLTSMSEELKGLATMDADRQAEHIESAIAFAYGYAKDAGLDLDMDESPYSVEQLEQILFVEKRSVS